MRAKPKKSLGQNWLVDNNIRNKILSSCSFGTDDIVFEVGSGKGEITRLIAEKVKQVYALEIDARLFPELNNNLIQSNNVKIFQGDILEFDLLENLKPGKDKIKVFGNIPYYISSPIIEYLINYRTNISEIYLTTQKEFA